MLSANPTPRVVVRTPAAPVALLSQRRLIRPPDPAIRGRTLQYMPAKAVPSHNAVRRLLHCAFRDAASVLDVTYGAGGCWKLPLPPGIDLTTNDLDPDAGANLRLDYRATGLADGTFDVVVYDPPHTADNGQSGYFWARYRGTARGNDALVDDVVAGSLEAWRVSRLGIIVKLTDASHGSELVMLSYEVIRALGARAYGQITTYRPAGIADPKHTVQRTPDSNGAIYLAFRHGSHQHRDFDRLYGRPVSRLESLNSTRKRCDSCDTPMLSNRRSDARTCSDRCRTALKRRLDRRDGRG